MEKFEVGDIVWSDVHGKGQIIEIPGYTHLRETAFISAVFYKDGAVIVYTADGRESPDEEITLHHFEEEPEVKLDFKEYNKVLVINDDRKSRWFPALFSHYVKTSDGYFCQMIGDDWLYPLDNVIPYKGNENLVTHIFEDF